MKLTPEQAKSITQWNALGNEVTENAIKHFLASWFSNARSLIRAAVDFPLHSIETLASWLEWEYNSFIVLGSGPSIPKVLKTISFSPYGAIFCGPTCLGAFAREGLLPTALIVADSNPQQYYHVVESKISCPETLNVVLPVTADPCWYDRDSILDRSRLFFYLPYMDALGSTDIGYNHILRELFPEVHRWIAQAGCVSNVALNFADMCCGDSTNKHIYIGVDHSWIKNGPVRSPLRFDPSKHNEMLRDFWKAAETHVQRTDVIDVDFQGETIQTDLLQIGYAVCLFHILHSWWRIPEKRDRYILIDETSKLFRAVSPGLNIPLTSSGEIGKSKTPVTGEENWAYKILIALIELSNTLQDRVKKEAENVKTETPVETELE